MNVSGIATQAKKAVLKRAGRAYLAGPTLQDAVTVADAARRDGHAATLSYWNGEGDTRADVTARVTAMVEAAGQRASWCDVAVKVPALAYDHVAVAGLAGQCADRGVRMWVDSHQSYTADRTLELAEAAAVLGCEVGVALPARWGRTRADAQRVADAGLAVRLVKGQFRDEETGGHDDVRGAFLTLVDALAGRARFVALASHDDWLLEQACSRLAGSGTPFEIQLLHGLPARRALEVARAAEAPVRIYAPFGHPSLVYSVRTMWENRRLVGRFAQDVVFGGRSAEMSRH
jgi:proline dehydrogenase